MLAIIPNQSTDVTPESSGHVEQAPAVVSGRSVQNALTGIAEKLTDALAAEQPAAWPFWKTEPCPAWCDGSHMDSDFDSDRNHWLTGGAVVELSLHDPWRVPACPASENVTGRDIPAAYGPHHLDVAAVQHYRASAPDVLLAVPLFGSDEGEMSEMEVRLTTAEAAALRDRLTAIVDTLTVAPPMLHASRHVARPVWMPVLTQVDPSKRESEMRTVAVGGRGVCIEACLAQWTEVDSPPQLEVLIDVADNPDGHSPAQAREVAERLQQIAGTIAELADQAEAYNETLL